MQNPSVRVLLIEDDQDDYVLTRELLREIDGDRFHLDWAPTYEDGLKRLQAGLHDVYLIDYRLGPDSGLQLLREAVQTGLQAPVIMLTGRADREIDMSAMEAGAADYVEKMGLDAQRLERSIRYSLERSRLLKKITDLASHDSITGLYNRRELLRCLDYEIGRCRRYQHPLSFVFMDLDDFKKINDRFGHPVGDEALRQVARTLDSLYRRADVLARFGGDEFAVLMPETSADDARQGAERLRHAIEIASMKLDHPDGTTQDVKITISLGVAEYPGDANSRDALIGAADRALYDAKRQGRNRVVQFHAEQAEGMPENERRAG